MRKTCRLQPVRRRLGLCQGRTRMGKQVCTVPPALPCQRVTLHTDLPEHRHSTNGWAHVLHGIISNSLAAAGSEDEESILSDSDSSSSSDDEEDDRDAAGGRGATPDSAAKKRCAAPCMHDLRPAMLSDELCPSHVRAARSAQSTLKCAWLDCCRWDLSSSLSPAQGAGGGARAAARHAAQEEAQKRLL